MNKKIFIIIISLLVSVKLFSQTRKIVTDVFFSMSADSTSDCYYANVSGCRLYKITLEIIKDSIAGIQSINVVGDSLKQVLPHNVPSAMPGINEDGTKIGFSSAGSFTVGSVNFQSEKLYTYDSNTGVYTLISDGSTLNNNKGKWIKWLNDSTIMYSSPNYCQSMGTLPGCGNTNPPTRFEDLRYATGDFSTGNVNTDIIGLGNVNPTTNLISQICSASDPVFNPQQNNLVAFHSTASDGYANNGGDNDCPFTIGLSNMYQTNYSDPKPVVFDINSSSPYNQIDSLAEGVNYWLFDLDSVKINSLVHLHWNNAGTIIIGNEQNTVAKPYIECINNPGVQVPNANACSSQSKAIEYERIFGFEKSGNRYKNIMRTIADTLPLFQPKPPHFLPNSASYFNPATDLCEKYRTKYVEFCGSNTSIVGTVMCSNVGGNLFSRIMFIDYTNYNNPYYFDITGWIEQHYSSWSPGNAEGIATTCRVISDSVLITTSITNTIPDSFEFNVYSSNEVLVVQGENISEVSVYDVMGRVVYTSQSSGNNYFNINTSAFSKGMYVVKAINKNKISGTRKIIK